LRPIATSIRLGLRTGVANRTAAVWTYVTTLAAALPPAVIAGVVIHSRLGHSLSNGEFAKHLDPILWVQLVRDRGPGVEAIIPAFIGGLVLWAIVTTYTAGAIISAVSRSEPVRSGEFFGSGGRVFGRLMRLLSLGLPFVLLLTGLSAFGLYKGTNWLTENFISEKAVLGIRIASVILGALVFSWASGAYDFMKVEAVARGEHRARYAFVRGLSRAARAPIPVLFITVPFAGTAALATIVWSLADAHLSRSSWLLFAIGLLAQQAVVFFRALVKLSLFGAEVAFVMLAPDPKR
jgi:hypothetical protein